MEGFRISRKGQGDWKWIVAIIIAMAVTVLILGLWSFITDSGGIPTSPEDYAQSWGDYGEFAFDWDKGDQPWRLLAIFFFPLIAYFTLIFGSFTMVFARANGTNWNVIQRPFLLFSFAVAFLILPFPTTYSLYQIIGGVTFLVPVFVWLLAIGIIILAIKHMSNNFSGGGGAGAGAGAAGGGGGGGGPAGGGGAALTTNVNVAINNAIIEINGYNNALVRVVR